MGLMIAVLLSVPAMFAAVGIVTGLADGSIYRNITKAMTVLAMLTPLMIWLNLLNMGLVKPKN